MRVCAQCQSPDRPHVDPSERCTCGTDTHEHAPDCRALTHEVVLFPVRMSPLALTYDKKLPAKWIQRGWHLWQDGQRFYRRKMLCRDCIGKQETQQAFARDYQKACKKARGSDDMTYAQAIASQDFF